MERFLDLVWAMAKLGLIVALVAWILFRWWRRSEDERLISKWILTAAVGAALIFVVAPIVAKGGPVAAFVGVPAAAVCGLALAILWASNIGGVVARPFEALFSGGEEEIEPQPLYSIAEARRKQGKYAQAIAEVRGQLARFPTDFTGHLMLAQIQAEDLKDLPGASDTIERWLAQEGHRPANIAHALNRLADWHLRLARDPDAAREALERIPRLFPDTELSQLAAERIAHLSSRELLAERLAPRVIALERHEEHFGLRESFSDLIPADAVPETVAADYVARLEQHPLDTETREKLAVLYADRLQRLDLALEQLDQMIEHPHQPPKHVVHWLHLKADLHIKYGGDISGARAALEQVSQRFPGRAAAEIARNRIPYLPLELKGQQKSQVVKLGSYEANIGLKKGWPT